MRISFQSNSSPYFAGLLEYLRANGFRVEVGHYARVHQLLDGLKEDYRPEDLKTLLGPLFASNADEQRRFYDIFDSYLGWEEGRLPPPEVLASGREAKEVVQAPHRFRPGHIALLVLLTALLLLPWLLFEREQSSVPPTQSPTSTPTLSPTPMPPTSVDDSGFPRQTPPSVLPTPQQPSQLRHLLGYLSILLTGLLLFSLHELLLRRRRRRLLEKQHDKIPPASWPLRVNALAPKLYVSEDFHQAARLMRRRQDGLFQRLHLPETIAATVRSLGYLSFRYRPDTRIPEYLILIDSAGPDDHQAALFDELYKALRREGVFAVRYFYEGDPRLCYGESRKERRYLTELRSRYARHRLLIFGSGEKLIDPTNGELAPWCALFAGWNNRALLTPVSPLQWGSREAHLARQFVLLPATSKGLRALVTRLALPAEMARGRASDELLPPLPRLNSHDLVAILRAYLGEMAFQWLCACALHRQLRWGLSLQLGSLPSLGLALVTEENLLRLVRLPWFRQGKLPDELRHRLSEVIAPEIEKETRVLLAEQLKDDSPPSGTFAAAARRLEVALHEWMLRGDPENLRHLNSALADVPPGDVLQDQMLAGYLRQMPAPLLSRWLPRRFFRSSIPAFGLNRFARLLIVLCLIALGSLVLRASYQGTDVRASYQGTNVGLPLSPCPPIPTTAVQFIGIPAELKPALDSVNADDLLQHIKDLSSDAYEGRGPGTKGETLSVNYITDEFKRIGLKPGNPDGTFVQKVPLAGFRAEPGATLKAGAREMHLENLKDYVAVSRRYEEQVDVDDSDIVFVGYGVSAPEYGWDDYKGVDVRGKTIVMLINDPAVPLASDPTKLDPNVFKGDAMTYYGRWTYKYEEASRRGAAACIIVHEEGPAGYPFEVVSGSWGRENFDIVSPDKNASRVGVESWITLDRAKELFAAAGQDFDALKRAATTKDFKPVALNAKATFHIKNTLRTIDSQNVIAKLEGSDPSLKNEYVIYMAHWDHLGKDDAAQGDGIFNGAIDNASGVASVLEIAEAFTKLSTPPKRSVLFMMVTGEEKGLLGAKYYAEHPLYPLTKTLADINIDGVNQWGRTKDITLVGLGNSTLDDVAAAAAREQGGRTLKPDSEPGKGFYYRSDHFEFAKQGVPALDPGAGVQYVGKEPDFAQKKRKEYEDNDYHKPSDEVKPDWDLSGAVEDAQLLLATGYNVLQGDRYPEWKSGTEFKARRDESFKAAGCVRQ